MQSSDNEDAITPASRHQRYADLRSRNERRAQIARALQAQRKQRDERVVQAAHQRRFGRGS